MKNFLNLLSPSRMDLVQFVKRRGQVTVEDAMHGLGLAETTIRQHFDRLEEKGLLGHESVARGPGRPTSVYHLTEAGRRLYPSQDGQLLGEMVEFLMREGYPGLIDQFYHETWSQRRERLNALIDEAQADTLEERVAVIAEFLEAEGFFPEVEHDGERVTIRECNCPFAEGVRATRLPCRLEAQLLEQVLGRELSRVGYMPDGQSACVYEFDLDDEADAS